VYEAFLSGDTPPDRVALKEPLSQDTLTTEGIEDFLNEAETWETIDRRERQKPRWDNAEHIVGIIDTGEELPWIAMEYMDGGSLTDRLDAHPEGLQINKALWIGECICRGVEIAHNCGVAHLDLKPDNILFRTTPEGKWAVPKVADWGMSQALSANADSTEGLSVEYAAPEQFKPKEFGKPDTLTDIYQVGAIVYSLLTGEPPYTGSQTSIKSDALQADPPTPVSTLRNNSNEVLDTVVQTALARSKSDRYRSITTFQQALRGVRTEQFLPPAVARQVNPDALHISRQSLQAADGRHTRTSIIFESTCEPERWPMFRGGPARTGYHPFDAGPRQTVTEQWRCKIESDLLTSSPSVVDGTAYISTSGAVYALNQSDSGMLFGPIKWQYSDRNLT
jgi:serine/threonine protein kinase